MPAVYLKPNINVTKTTKMGYNTTDATYGVGTSPSGAPEFTLGFQWVSVTRPLVFCIMFCRSLFVFNKLLQVRSKSKGCKAKSFKSVWDQ
jgi:hypothetical protein